MRRTVWLASYPKSGNTWFRIFLANLLHPGLAPVGINSLPVSTPIAASRLHFDDMLGVPSALLMPTEAACLRPSADLRLNATWEGGLLVRKVHDAYTWLADGRPLLGQAPQFAAVYILRDPWDVAVSMTNHFSCTLAAAVGHLCNPHFAVASGRKGLSNQLPQRLLSWEGHASSWLDAPMPLHVLRYEQMRRDPLASFRGAVRFLGLDHDDRAIEAALEACRFERLQRQEDEQRFKETPRHTPRFFRSATVGEGVDKLAPEDLQRLEAMKRRVDAVIAARSGR